MDQEQRGHLMVLGQMVDHRKLKAGDGIILDRIIFSEVDETDNSVREFLTRTVRVEQSDCQPLAK